MHTLTPRVERDSLHVAPWHIRRLLRQAIAKHQNARIPLTKVTAALQLQAFRAVQRHGRALRTALNWLGQRD